MTPRGQRQTVDRVMRRLPPPARSQLPAPGDDGNEIPQTGDFADGFERLPRVSMHHHQIAGLQLNVAFRAPLAFEILFDVDPHRDAVSIWILTEDLDRGLFSSVGESARLGDGVEHSHWPRHDDDSLTVNFSQHDDLRACGLDQLDAD